MGSPDPLSPPPVLSSRRNTGRGSRPNATAHHPAPLGDSSIAFESELLKQVLGAGVKVGASLGFSTVDLFGVCLHEPAASFLDGIQGGSHCRPRDPAASVTLAGEDTADPPVGHLVQLFEVRLRIIDGRQLCGGAVLTPPHARLGVIDQNLVDRSLPHVRLLDLAVGGGAASAEPFGMKPHAPAAAPDAVVRLY